MHNIVNPGRWLIFDNDDNRWIALIVEVDHKNTEPWLLDTDLPYPGWVKYLVNGNVVSRPLYIIDDHIRSGLVELV